MACKDEDEYAMDSKMLEISMHFIMHSDYEARKSALVHFFGVLGGYDGWTRWREVGTYTLIPV